MINFEVIGKKIHKYLDTDLMDIKRNGQEIYSNIPCNIQINQADNPDPTAVDVVPIISSLTINMPQYVDVQNNDRIVAKRMSNDGKVLEVYKGNCGFPSVWQARKSVNMTMSTLQADDDVTPPPPKEQSVIKIDYKDLIGNIIKPSIEKIVEANKQADIFPAMIDGYELKNSYLDGVLQDSQTVIIPSASKDGHNVLFEYDTTSIITYLRVLVNGAYTKDDGAFAFGYHLYKKMPIKSVAGSNGNYILTTDIDRFVHDDNGEIKFTKGLKLKLFASNEWVQISSNPVLTDDGYEFETEPYIPTESEANAYITGWYEVVR